MELVRINRFQWIVIFFGLFLLLILQSGFAQTFGANLLLIFGIIASFQKEAREVFIIAVILGLLSDFASGLPDGILLIVFPILMLGLYFTVSFVLPKHENLYVQVLLFFGAIIAFYLLTFVTALLFGSTISLTSLWPELVLDSLFFFPVYYYYLSIIKLCRYAIRSV